MCKGIARNLFGDDVCKLALGRPSVELTETKSDMLLASIKIGNRW
jgi:hypothetical protein